MPAMMAGSSVPGAAKRSMPWRAVLVVAASFIAAARAGEIRRVDEFTEWLSKLYNRPVSHEDTVSNLELFSKQVMPRLKAYSSMLFTGAKPVEPATKMIGFVESSGSFGEKAAADVLRKAGRLRDDDPDDLVDDPEDERRLAFIGPRARGGRRAPSRASPSGSPPGRPCRSCVASAP